MMTSLCSKWAVGKAVRAGLAVGGRMSKSICNRSGSGRTAAGPFSTQPFGPRPVGCFSALLARPVSIQIWALRSLLEKQPTDLRRNQRDLGDGTLARRALDRRDWLAGRLALPDKFAKVNPVATLLLEIIGLTKGFPGVKALDAVDFAHQRGEIHAL